MEKVTDVLRSNELVTCHFQLVVFSKEIIWHRFLSVIPCVYKAERQFVMAGVPVRVVLLLACMAILLWKPVGGGSLHGQVRSLGSDTRYSTPKLKEVWTSRRVQT